MNSELLTSKSLPLSLSGVLSNFINNCDPKSFAATFLIVIVQLFLKIRLKAFDSLRFWQKFCH
jgi:hypothetical protein